MQIVETASKYQLDPETIFTLPGREMLDIPVFRQAFPKARIVGVEQSKKDFDIISKYRDPCFTINHTTIQDYVRNQFNTTHHGIVFLDYLGWLDEEKLKDIKDFAANQNIIKSDQKTVLAITLQKSNRKGSEFTDALVSRVWQDQDWTREESKNSIESITAAVWVELSKSRPNVILEDYSEYKNNGGVPMYFMLFVLE